MAMTSRMGRPSLAAAWAASACSALALPAVAFTLTGQPPTSTDSVSLVAAHRLT